MTVAAEPQLITADEFVADFVYALRAKGQDKIVLRDNDWDEMFSSAFEALWSKQKALNIIFDFNMVTDRYHGDSAVLREALYALRERKVVAINNPSFLTVDLIVDEGVASKRLEKSSLGRALVKSLVDKHFAVVNACSDERHEPA